MTKNQTFDPFDRVTFQAEKVGAQSSVSTRYTFGGGNPIGRVELDGHMNREESYGGGFTTENLERCGSGCRLDGSNPVSGSSGDSFNNAVDNVFVGMLSGGIKTVEAAAAGPLAPILALTGAGVGSQFDNFAADHGAETDSAAFTAGEIIGIPIPAGAGAKVADRTAASLADKAASKLADEAADTVMSRVAATQGARDVGSALPKSFNLTRSAGANVWVAPNATKHIWEETRGLTFGRQIAEQQRLAGLAGAVDNAVIGRWGRMQV